MDTWVWGHALEWPSLSGPQRLIAPRWGPLLHLHGFSYLLQPSVVFSLLWRILGSYAVRCSLVELVWCWSWEEEPPSKCFFTLSCIQARTGTSRWARPWTGFLLYAGFPYYVLTLYCLCLPHLCCLKKKQKKPAFPLLNVQNQLHLLEGNYLDKSFEIHL